MLERDVLQFRKVGSLTVHVNLSAGRSFFKKCHAFFPLKTTKRDITHSYNAIREIPK